MFWKAHLAWNTHIDGNLASWHSDQTLKVRDLQRVNFKVDTALSLIVNHENQYDEREELTLLDYYFKRISFRNIKQRNWGKSWIYLGFDIMWRVFKIVRRDWRENQTIFWLSESNS